MASIQYTVRGVSPDLDSKLRRAARGTGKSLNAVVVETLEHAMLPPAGVIHEDLDWFVGQAPTRESEPEAAQAWLDALPTEPV
jgi:hypothetical protein